MKIGAGNPSSPPEPGVARVFMGARRFRSFRSFRSIRGFRSSGSFPNRTIRLGTRKSAIERIIA